MYGRVCKNVREISSLQGHFVAELWPRMGYLDNWDVLHDCEILVTFLYSRMIIHTKKQLGMAAELFKRRDFCVKVCKER